MHIRSIDRIAFTLLLLSAMPGCSAFVAARKSAQRTQSSHHMRQLAVAIHDYHEANQQWPDNLDQVESLIPKNGFATFIKNPFTGDDPGYEYVKPADNAPLSETVMLYQLRNGKRDTTLPVGFGDAAIRMMNAE